MIWMMTSRSNRPLIIWRITDGKPGHEKQTLGLAHALLKLRPGKCIDLAAPARGEALKQWLLGRFSAGLDLPAPDILLGAGHATHFALLAARRAYGGKTVVLMKPSLPLSWFDLCVIPEHDNPPPRRNVIRVQGVLNDVQASQTTSPDRGLILIGGVSSHYGWDNNRVAATVARIVESTPGVDWQLTTSRRTPATFLAALPQPLPGNIELIPHDATGPGWLEQALGQAGQVWVTEDSVSMLYEALTAGAGVGLLRLPAARDTRVRRGVQKLIENGWVTPFEAWRNGEPLPFPEREFNEATRVAEQILTSLENHATT
jgi:mitochondrial fission protein ELM1